jgi:hypothetical protein
MGLFQTLLRLYPDSVPQENVFTEIVAYLFRAYPDLLDAWLVHFNLTGQSGYPSAVIHTQSSFLRLEQHDSASRVDITFDLSDGQYTDTIFLEAKISAREGPSQLQRYAEHLAALPDRRKRILLYVTRDDEHPWLTSIDPLVEFRHIHWYEFFRFLAAQPPNTLIQELIVYMKESRDGARLLGLDPSITSQQVRDRWLIPWKQVEQALQGRVRQRFAEIAGSTWDFPPSEREDMLRHWGTFAPYHRWDESQLRCWLSLWVDPSGDLPPKLQLFLQVKPVSTHRHTIIRKMKSIATRPGWYADDLDQLTWSGVYYIRDIPANSQDFQYQETLIAEFMSMLDELEAVDREYSLFAI